MTRGVLAEVQASHLTDVPFEISVHSRVEVSRVNLEGVASYREMREMGPSVWVSYFVLNRKVRAILAVAY